MRMLEISMGKKHLQANKNFSGNQISTFFLRFEKYTLSFLELEVVLPLIFLRKGNLKRHLLPSENEYFQQTHILCSQSKKKKDFVLTFSYFEFVYITN